MAGKVFCNNKLVKKSGEAFNEDISIKILKNENWVSRGALKLSPLIISKKINIKNMICLDIGSSTGGFTEVLLSSGAKKVYAVDVGYGQLHEKIKSNKKVISFERKNARYLTSMDINERVDIIVCDASFISFKKIINTPLNFLKKNGKLIGLIKPQFEAKRNEIKRGGIVKDKLVHNRVCEDIKNWLIKEKNYTVSGIFESSLRGTKGNIEYFVIAIK